MGTVENGALSDGGLSAYERTLEWLYGLRAAKGMDFKLDRMAKVLRQLGDPHHAFPAIHVAGTNGKGSVAAMLHSILTCAGYRVGIYVSPHLVRFTERIRVGRDEVAPDTVVRLAGEVRAASKNVGVEPTFFELVTLMAFLHFSRSPVDVCVIEVGLGGRLDATNVIDPLVTVITTIGLDHTEFLGESIARVAAEKAGAIKPTRPVVVGNVGVEAERVIVDIATERQAPIYRMGRDYRWSWENGFCFEGIGHSWPGLSLALRGPHQHDNAATALAAVAVLAEQFPVLEEAVRHGLDSVEWPGRLQVVSGEPMIVLDCAHNLDGVLALGRALPSLIGKRAVHVLFAVMKDKDWQPMVDELGPACASATTTEVHAPRCLEAAALAESFRRYCPTAAQVSVPEAWQEVCRKAGPADVVLVTGSLFLVGAVSEIVAHRSGIHAMQVVEAAHP
jgi:dihydrofolate synthase/folylpolyglutamate synthase